jgi:hypothetical protein
MGQDIYYYETLALALKTATFWRKGCICFFYCTIIMLIIKCISRKFQQIFFSRNITKNLNRRALTVAHVSVVTIGTYHILLACPPIVINNILAVKSSCSIIIISTKQYAIFKNVFGDWETKRNVKIRSVVLFQKWHFCRMWQ